MEYRASFNRASWGRTSCKLLRKGGLYSTRNFQRTSNSEYVYEKSQHYRSSANMSVHVAFKRPPFRINEEGWGEFDMRIALHTTDKSGDQSIAHDLNFQSEHYETKHTVVGSSIVNPFYCQKTPNIFGLLPDLQEPKGASPCYSQRVRVSARRCEWSEEQGRICKEKEEARQRSMTVQIPFRYQSQTLTCPTPTDRHGEAGREFAAGGGG